MSFEAWITLGMTVTVLLIMAGASHPPDLIMIGALTLLLTVGVLPPHDALAGFATILGGLCTLIGTSTNGHHRRPAPGSHLGVPGLLRPDLGGPPLRPRRPLAATRPPAPLSVQDDARQYTVEMLVEPGSPLIGKTVEDAGLRHLVGMYLMEIDRDGGAGRGAGGEGPAHLRRHRRLGGRAAAPPGPVPRHRPALKLSVPRPRRCLVKAGVSNSSRLLGQSIRDGRFRSVYNFSDHLRFGGLLNLVVAAVTLTLTPLIWPFTK